jgi:SAM-dependent methyltransferase
MSASASGVSTPPQASPGFDDLYARIVASAVLKDIWRVAFGSEYPDEASPFSFVTRTDLAALLHALALDSAHRLVDLGCGCGGFAVHIAQQTGATVVGIDTSTVAIAQAQALAERRGLRSRATFLESDAAATPLPAHIFDGALCLDALQMMPKPAAVLAEIARLLRPGGKVGLTTWSFSEPWRGRAVIPDYRPLLEESGFEVLACDEPDGWKARQLQVYDLMRKRRSELEVDLGATASGLLLDEAENAPAALAKSRRVRIVAQLRE